MMSAFALSRAALGCATFLSIFTGTALAAATDGDVAGDYAHAERFLFWNKDRYVINGDIQHHWIGAENRFWYLRTAAGGAKAFVVVDAATGRKSPAFDQRKIAAALSKARQQAVSADALPFTSFHYAQNGKAIEFYLGDLWTCAVNGASCKPADKPAATPEESVSPDGKLAVSLRDHNLWVRPLAGGEGSALTTDGIEHFDYASVRSDTGRIVSDQRHPLPAPPQVSWSADSQSILTYRVDERNVKELHLIQSVPPDGSIRPKLYSYRYPMPGDDVIPAVQPIILNVKTKAQIAFAMTPTNAPYDSLLATHYLWWAPDYTKAYFLKRDRYSKSVHLVSLDPATGQEQVVIEEHSTTWVRLNGDEGVFSPGGFSPPAVATLRNGDIIWFSERDGWGHLYNYGRAGGSPQQITHGDWLVRTIVKVDEERKQIYFMASGRDPGEDAYEQHLYRVNLDGSDLRTLTPERADHDLVPFQNQASFEDRATSAADKARFSASGRYFVDNYSRPDVPPVMVVRSAEGELVKEVERADISPLTAGGFTPVEPFKAVAADGKTAIYGNLFRPSRFDAAQAYPVIDADYPGPQLMRTGKSFSGSIFEFMQAQTLAELGFIVITVDGRGTPHRAKAFEDHVYGQLDKGSDLDDHIAAIRQLAQKYPYLDLSRVGVWGLSGGGYAAANAILSHPEFYKVAVAAEGNQDQRGYFGHWAETYMGPDQSRYARLDNAALAGNLQGKLMLMHGDMDDNVSPSLTLKLVDALVKANKDFDLVILPNANHMGFLNPYFIRRQWDFFVRNLQGREPPAQYKIAQPDWVVSALMR
jgi:dipeptidyl-peptidase-4